MQNLTDDLSAGFGLASLQVLPSLMTALVAKGVLTMKDCAAIYSCALQELQQKKPSPGGREQYLTAQQVLQNLVNDSTANAKGN